MILLERKISPTKQARGDSGKEPKLHRWQNGEKTLGETGSVGGQFPSGQTKGAQTKELIVL